MPVKRILGLTIVFMLLIGMAGIGTWAYFSDPETVTVDTFAAGTLDLKTDDIDGVSQTLFAVNMEPGDTIGSEYITLKNTGSVAGATLDLVFSYVESDISPNPVNMNSDNTAAMMEVTALKYGLDDLLGSGSDINGNTYADIEDLKNTDLSGQSSMGASESKDFEIAIKLRDSTGGDFQADGINVTITFTLNQ